MRESCFSPQSSGSLICLWLTFDQPLIPRNMLIMVKTCVFVCVCVCACVCVCVCKRGKDKQPSVTESEQQGRNKQNKSRLCRGAAERRGSNHMTTRGELRSYAFLQRGGPMAVSSHGHTSSLGTRLGPPTHTTSAESHTKCWEQSHAQWKPLCWRCKRAKHEQESEINTASPGIYVETEVVHRSRLWRFWSIPAPERKSHWKSCRLPREWPTRVISSKGFSIANTGSPSLSLSNS